MKIEAVIEDFIRTWEGGLSVDPDDTGNWFYEKGQKPVLVGSQYGVTGAALAAHRGVTRITPADMQALRIEEAVAIGVRAYYDKPDFDLLPWNQVTASLVDMGWGAGPGQAAKLLQRMVGASPDGQIGQRTAAAYHQFLREHPIEEAADLWAEQRYAFYDRIIATRPTNAKYRRGWRRRTDGFLPGTSWWAKWPEALREAA
ncbi:glycoside hydrolase family 108 protein [Sphingomonas montanisoli]|uniref:Uncharacterized protein n=1 Tax=Sphingomonas montanisoli TaxID=2606412 RepID=A0A5D9C8C3_9SPHN|nr:glycosyl hydrolase 108 family protein [Sphingomonas montanisoli]TZG27586.1 hypothetical protein FYJ91_08350 [Sphingomonas montanisoli]